MKQILINFLERIIVDLVAIYSEAVDNLDGENAEINDLNFNEQNLEVYDFF